MSRPATLIPLPSGKRHVTFDNLMTCTFYFGLIPFCCWLCCRFKFIADCLVCVFSLLSLLFVFALSRRQWNVKYYFYIFLHDLVCLDHVYYFSFASCNSLMFYMYISIWSEWDYFCNWRLKQVLLILLTSGCSAGTAVGLVARNGEAKIGWPPICDLFPKFCHKITWSIAFSYLALGCLFILPVLSVAKLKLSAT